MDNLKETFLNPSDLAKESPFKDLPIKCALCQTIPIDTIECDKCDNLFCHKCIANKLNGNATGKAKELMMHCPNHYNKNILNKKVNKLLNDHVIEKLVFKHKCCSKEPKNKRETKKNLKNKTSSNFQNFKYGEMIEHLKTCLESEITYECPKCLKCKERP